MRELLCGRTVCWVQLVHYSVWLSPSPGGQHVCDIAPVMLGPDNLEHITETSGPEWLQHGCSELQSLLPIGLHRGMVVVVVVAEQVLSKLMHFFIQ